MVQLGWVEDNERRSVRVVSGSTLDPDLEAVAIGELNDIVQIVAVESYRYIV